MEEKGTGKGMMGQWDMMGEVGICGKGEKQPAQLDR